MTEEEQVEDQGRALFCRAFVEPNGSMAVMCRRRFFVLCVEEEYFVRARNAGGFEPEMLGDSQQRVGIQIFGRLNWRTRCVNNIVTCSDERQETNNTCIKTRNGYEGVNAFERDLIGACNNSCTYCSRFIYEPDYN